MVSEIRKYSVLNTNQAKMIVRNYLLSNNFNLKDITFGLPEIHDRYNIWNVPIIYKNEIIGEIAIDAFSSNINRELSSNVSVLYGRIEKVLNQT